MDALAYWRASSLKKRVSEDLLQFTTPLSPSPITTQRYQQRESIVDQQAHIRSQSEPPSVAEMRKAEEEDKIEAVTIAGGKENGATNSMGGAKKPTSSSWVQWWSRSRKKGSGTANKDTPRNVKDVSGVLHTVRLSC